MADEESAKMVALKKAYAEIILNTSKEAAVKIMAADHKAVRFQKDLLTLKEDALRMLVHLKQMLDFRTAEAKIRSENQQKKIEKLEAQLSEAEGIIVDLREELSLTQDKLQKMKCSQKLPVRHHTSEYQEKQLPFRNKLIAKTDKRQYTLTANACTTKYPAEMLLPKQYSCRDQQNTSAKEQPSEHVLPPNTFVNVKTSKQQYSSCSSDSDEKDVKIKSNGSAPKSLEHESSFRRTRKNVKYQEAIAALCRSSRGRRAKSYQPRSFPKCRKRPNEFPDNSNFRESDLSWRSSRGRRAKSCQSRSFPKCRNNAGNLSEVNDNIAPERTNEFPDNSNIKESDLSCDVDTHKFDTALSDCNVKDVQIPEESERISNRSDNDKVLKFTFQRKRKREVLTKLDNNITPEVNNGLSRALLEQGDDLKDEQSKDSRLLMQVAHQLISLSENGHT